MSAEASSQLLATLLWRPAAYHRSQLPGASWMAATGSFMNLAGYFPNRKRLKYKRHTFQRFLLVLKGNSSFHFLCCITPLWHLRNTTWTLLPHTLSVPSIFAARNSRSLSGFPKQQCSGLQQFKRLGKGNSIHLTLLRKISARPSKGANQQPFLNTFLGPSRQQLILPLKGPGKLECWHS